MRIFFLSVCILISFCSSGQKITGTVFTEKGDLLPYSSVTIKGSTIGASANAVAKYSINLSPGNYTVVCQHIGYAMQEKNVTVTAGQNEELSFVLTQQKLLLKEVVVTRGEDPAISIIRNAIKMRPYYAGQVKAFECDLYEKNMLKLEQMPDAIFGIKVPKEGEADAGLDSSGRGIIYLAENISRVSIRRPGKLKVEVKSSRVSGSNSFGFTFPTFISLYDNNVMIFSEKLNPRGFISPIANNAFNYYAYHFLGSFFENGLEINSIMVIPKRKYEPLFRGIINIVENDWRIHSANLVLTKSSQLEVLDTLVVNQQHVPVNDSVWVVKDQLLHVNLNQFGIGISGNFVNAYSGYSINPEFAKGYFGNVVIKYDTGANKMPKSYWENIRPIPLEVAEINDYRLRDSLQNIVRVDTGSKKKNKIKITDIFWGGYSTGKQKANKFSWELSPLLKGLEYNPAEGLVTNVAASFSKRFDHSSHNLVIDPSVRYGFADTHLDPAIDIQWRTREFESNQKLKREKWELSFGKRVNQFNKESSITPLVNSLSTLLYGDNFMKTYENNFAFLEFNKRYESGFRFSVNSLYEDRMPLNNVTDFTIFEKNKKYITPNFPTDKLTSQFLQHQAFIVSVEASIRPGQKYIQYPDKKISLGSKYPTLTLNYSKGIKNILGSDVDFDKWKLTVKDDKNFKMAGLFKYKISIGGFLSDRSVFIQDYQHFNGNHSFLAAEYLNSFQVASYYANSTTASFYSLAHLEHHFNGLITNKIPGLKQWNWNLVAGANTFYVNQNSNYFEFFMGIENIFKIFRVDVVTAFENGRQGKTAVRLGFGGLLSSAVKQAGNRSVTVGL